MQGHKVILDRDDIRRTLVRIAHEIVEKNPPDTPGIVMAPPVWQMKRLPAQLRVSWCVRVAGVMHCGTSC